MVSGVVDERLSACNRRACYAASIWPAAEAVVERQMRTGVGCCRTGTKQLHNNSQGSAINCARLLQCASALPVPSSTTRLLYGFGTSSCCVEFCLQRSTQHCRHSLSVLRGLPPRPFVRQLTPHCQPGINSARHQLIHTPPAACQCKTSFS